MWTCKQIPSFQSDTFIARGVLFLRNISICRKVYTLLQPRLTSTRKMMVFWEVAPCRRLSANRPSYFVTVSPSLLFPYSFPISFIFSHHRHCSLYLFPSSIPFVSLTPSLFLPPPHHLIFCLPFVPLSNSPLSSLFLFHPVHISENIQRLPQTRVVKN
jgi:hypothetical protein